MGYFVFPAKEHSDYKISLFEIREEQSFFQASASYSHLYPKDVPKFHIQCIDFVSDYRMDF
jgi:hypothetical protein